MEWEWVVVPFTQPQPVLNLDQVTNVTKGAESSLDPPTFTAGIDPHHNSIGTQDGRQVAQDINPGQKTKRPTKRMAAGEVWTDKTLKDWPENDFRIFVGDLAPDATDEDLVEAFRRYKSFNMARIVRDKKNGKCRGYGFVSFAEGEDMVSALREMNGKYVGNRPVKLKKSNWQKRNLTNNRRKELKLFRTIEKSVRY